MSNFFSLAIQFTLPHEVGIDKNGQLKADGGYTNDPRDPGGETKWGISKRAHPNLDIANLTLADALVIYKKEYYDTYANYKPTSIDLDSLPIDLAVAAFDTGVNCGVGRTFKWLAASLETKEPTNNLLALRKAFYAANKNFYIYGKGWLARVNDLSKYCSVLAAGNIPTGQSTVL